MFSSSFIVPYTEGNGIPVPIELGVEPEAQGGVLGYPTSSFHSVAHRNWVPYSWDASGTSVAGWAIGGYTTVPGPITGGSEIISEQTDVTVMGDWSKQGFAPVKICPDFSLPTNPRQMLDWWGDGADGYYPVDQVAYVDGVYPIYWDEFGMNSTAWYYEVTFRLFAELGTYRLKHNDIYWVEFNVRVEISSRGVPQPGAEPPGGWLPTEGTNINFNGGGCSSRSDSGSVCGQVQVHDDTLLDPNPGWGSQNLYGYSGFDSDLTLHVVGQHLPRPDYP